MIDEVRINLRVLVIDENPAEARQMASLLARQWSLAALAANRLAVPDSGA